MGLESCHRISSVLYRILGLLAGQLQTLVWTISRPPQAWGSECGLKGEPWSLDVQFFRVLIELQRSSELVTRSGRERNLTGCLAVLVWAKSLFVTSSASVSCEGPPTRASLQDDETRTVYKLQLRRPAKAVPTSLLSASVHDARTQLLVCTPPLLPAIARTRVPSRRCVSQSLSLDLIANSGSRGHT
ncbi:hypothetical protein DFH06DRAFT_1176100 [Mycena polygramma]|nr:hypothetical protein DFH06DRAFT_1176100 [Mycena polygramma]